MLPILEYELLISVNVPSADLLKIWHTVDTYNDYRNQVKFSVLLPKEVILK